MPLISQLVPEKPSWFVVVLWGDRGPGYAPRSGGAEGHGMQGESWGVAGFVFVLTSRHVVFYLHFSKLTLKALWTSTYSQSMFILGKGKRFNW